MTSTFDLTAATFDNHRSFPAGVPEAIRAAVFENIRKQADARVLDLGAGTGRIGRAFVDADDAYMAVDSSLAMLREFRAHNPNACLIQANGEQLPFRDHEFHVALLMQVLSGSSDSTVLLNEVKRVLAPGGAVVVGHTIAPSEGIDEEMKHSLTLILRDMGIEQHQPKKARKQSLEWLEARAHRRRHGNAATWTTQRTPKDFILRHQTGARFASLPVEVQQKALAKLSAWAEETFGSLEKTFIEEHTFEIDVFEFHARS